MRRKSDVPETKICAACKQPFVRRPKDAETRWLQRKYCSTDCAMVGKRHWNGKAGPQSGLQAKLP